MLSQALKNGGGASLGSNPASAIQPADSGARIDPDQAANNDFIKNSAKGDRGYHNHIAKPPVSKNEVKKGSFIPMTLETSINSDLPGLVSARVTEDVYDSISGCRLLIPAMSKVVGRYNSQIAMGQGRMLIVWNSLIFPNGDELDMGAMQGYDTSGQSGLESDVDNHYWQKFGVTLGLSMITSGVQLSVPQPTQSANGTTSPLTNSQIVATALTQQFGTLGAQIISKYMAIQPTLRNYAGERFVVIVPNTIVFINEHRNRCDLTGK
jgi:type IV secretory pathway VirB10-like protein